VLAEKRSSNVVSAMFFEQLESMTTCCNNRTKFEEVVEFNVNNTEYNFVTHN